MCCQWMTGRNPARSGKGPTQGHWGQLRIDMGGSGKPGLSGLRVGDEHNSHLEHHG